MTAPCRAPEKCYCAACRPDLFPRARNSDPATSHTAAARASNIAITHRNRVMAALSEDLTPREIAERSGVDYVAVQRRMAELERMGLAEPTGDTRNGCRVWRRAKAAA